MTDLLRLYLDPDEIGTDGYPYAWHGKYPSPRMPSGMRYEPFQPDGDGPIKLLIREKAGFRCERCGHPYPPGITDTCPRGEWTPCDEYCTHVGPLRWHYADGVISSTIDDLLNISMSLASWRDFQEARDSFTPEAQWRILTVHHLNGIKHDCRWWNLAALCQRCHLAIQGKVIMERIWPWEHSEWFKLHAAGWYASAYLGEDLTREKTIERLEELLALEQTAG